MIRIGHSTDIHRLEEGHQLMIGGVLVPHDKGSIGHSDADCLLHTVCESLLGALALGDLGKLFPDTSLEFKGIDSSILVQRVMKIITNKGFHVVNLDSTIFLERPKVQEYIPSMRRNIAALLNIDIEFVSVKATTGERVGIIGREEAIMAESVVLLSND